MITEVKYEGEGNERFVEFALPAMLDVNQVTVVTYTFTSSGGQQTGRANLDGSFPAASVQNQSTSADGVWRYVAIDLPAVQPAGGRYGVALVWNCEDGTNGVTDFIIYGEPNTDELASVAVDGLAKGGWLGRGPGLSMCPAGVGCCAELCWHPVAWTSHLAAAVCCVLRPLFRGRCLPWFL